MLSEWDFQNIPMITIFLGLFIFSLVWWHHRRPTIKLPPGPPGLPLLGNLHQFKQPPFLTYEELYREYGKVCYYRLGQFPMVIISSFDLLKSCLSESCFSGRKRTDFENYYYRDSGIIFTDGEKWSFHRRLALQILRDFGMGKSSSENIVHEEAVELCQHLDVVSGGENEKLIDTSAIFCCSTMNIVSHLLFGERPGYDNEEFNIIMNRIHNILNVQSFFVFLPILFPSLNVFGPLFRLSSMQQDLKKSHEFVLKKLAEHRQGRQYGVTEEPSNFVEAYYLAKEKYEKKMGNGAAKVMFNDWQIVRIAAEFYAAGTDTSSNTLCWATLLLGLHQSVREKMAEEIHNLIGTEKIVSMEDRKQFHYSLAVIDEVMRYSSVVPSSVFHATLTDTKIEEYDIPKNTVIVPNLYSIHHDPEIWEKPNEFYPQHFLSEDGMTYRPREHLIPFGIGKRSCLGESLARTELFIFIITLVQRYEFQVQFDLDKKESLENCLLGTSGINRAPGPHKIRLLKKV